MSTSVSKKQDASTAITTSNISNQSVKYATSAGSAGSVSGHATFADGWAEWHYNNVSRGSIFCNSSDSAFWIRANKGLLALVSTNTGVYTYSNDGLGVKAMDFNSWKPVYAASFNQASSREYKENIEEITEEEADKLLQLKPSTFDFKEEYGGKKGCYGLIAEEVEEIIPSVVTTMMGEHKGIDYSAFVPFLIKMVQMQNERITALEAKLDDIK